MAGIGMVGVTGIGMSHRAGARKAGLPIVAGFDVSPAARESFARDEPEARVYDSLDGLLADPAVEVVDIVVPHRWSVREPIVRAAAAAGKPMLIQKPLAMTYEQAVALADIIADAGVPAMVHQNMCFTPGVLAMLDAVMTRKAIGRVFYGEVALRGLMDIGVDHWFGKDERWHTVGHSVHHLSVLHMVLGPPRTVYAVLGRDPDQPGIAHEGWGHAIFTYPDGAQAVLTSTLAYYGVQPSSYGVENSYFQGENGIADWTANKGVTVSRRDGEDGGRSTESNAANGAWFPDAFGAVMSHFQQALAAGRQPRCSITDNLYVMAAAEAMYQSAASGQVVQLAQIMGERYDRDYGSGYSHGFQDWTLPTPILAATQETVM